MRGNTGTKADYFPKCLFREVLQAVAARLHSETMRYQVTQIEYEIGRSYDTKLNDFRSRFINMLDLGNIRKEQLRTGTAGTKTTKPMIKTQVALNW